jgi:hypothetical protein
MLGETTFPAQPLGDRQDFCGRNQAMAIGQSGFEQIVDSQVQGCQHISYFTSGVAMD